MKIIRNKAIVATRGCNENTYVRREYFWGLISHEELVHVKDAGYDIVIRVEDKPKNIYLQVGDSKPKKL